MESHKKKVGHLGGGGGGGALSISIPYTKGVFVWKIYPSKKKRKKVVPKPITIVEMPFYYNLVSTNIVCV